MKVLCEILELMVKHHDIDYRAGPNITLFLTLFHYNIGEMPH